MSDYRPIEALPHGLHCELSQPPDGTRAGKPLQPAEALKHRMARGGAHGSDYEQTNQKTDHSDTKPSTHPCRKRPRVPAY